MKHIIFTFLVLVLTACGGKNSTPQVKTLEAESDDSAAFRVALIPNKDCLPVYFAAQHGIYEKLGLRLRLTTYASQMDCDTALLGPTVDGGMADRVRLAVYGKRASGLVVQWNGTAEWQVFTCGTLRVKDVKSLKGRTVAIARQSAENGYLVAALKQSGVSVDEVYLPQINDLKLRASMLSGNQVDAAVLNWPYTSLALTEGHRRLSLQQQSNGDACFVLKRKILNKPAKKRQWELFEKGRRMALDSIRRKGPESYSLILQKEYGLPKSVADTIKYN